MNRNVWLHRNNHYNSDVSWKMLGFYKEGFSEKNGCYISVGCGSGKLEKESLEKIEKSGENKFLAFEEIYKNEVSSKMPKFRYSLYRFMFEFKKGDYLIIPSSRKFSIFQIESDILDYNDDEIKASIKKAGGNLEKIIENRDDFRYFRKLKPIKLNLLRNEYAIGALCSELKYRGTTKEFLDEAKEDVKRAVESDKPISLHHEITNALREPLLKEIQRISPEQLESLIKWYFKKIGADDAIILSKNPSSKNGKEDADVEAVFDNLKLIIYIQAKRHFKSSDLTEANKQIIDYKNKYDKEIDYSNYMKIYWIICTAEEANDDVVDESIRVIKGKEFAEMLLKAGLSKDIDEVLYKE